MTLFRTICATGLVVAFCHPVTADTATVDQLFDTISMAATQAGYDPVLEIDHARLAADAGVEMPASRVQIFMDPAVTAQLINDNIRAGLDLPYRVLAYDQTNQTQAIYTNGTFLQKRHGLSKSDALDAFDAGIETVVSTVSAPLMAAPTDRVDADFGILSLTSDFDYTQTIENLRSIVKAQEDTIWFADIDYATLPDIDTGTKATLLLFGGPAPGGVAMAEFPAIGLDAFCQKLLVYEDETGGVQVIFNSIVSLADLHYGTHAKPHVELDKRLTATFTKAVNP